MDKLILQCGRYYPPVQTDDAERLHRLESYVTALSSEAETLFETCERLRREITLRMAELDERLTALSATEAASVAVEMPIMGTDAATVGEVSGAPQNT